ncbi:hypothetical protein COT77_02885 [Candidatus Berkelbacteria bacterium CG10_big_fil_rev_8_21_14_0_10_41_12]|uniref:Uncharacterized protein n=1 Tax=Candidatus Berkelbacteria bacterium CG10_big_fil_rev_8_21_14_0_10_41_12 TaxID=1974513 RepID=A0A2M6WWP1_9BACT|nr:MAG: hypothetical protein COT77_02885 [Candidatus Berkelbacteria bacterium CG10_big_fil_rev_8_21_14_0_10_41_12]
MVKVPDPSVPPELKIAPSGLFLIIWSSPGGIFWYIYVMEKQFPKAGVGVIVIKNKDGKSYVMLH